MSDYYPDLQGWLSKEEGEELQKLAKDKSVLEIGCWKARSTIIMGMTAKEVVSIDHFQGDKYTGPARTFKEAWQNILDYDLHDKITLMTCRCEKALSLLDLSNFRFIFYDAGHDYQITYDTLEFLHLNTVGAIAVHDYRPGVEIWKPTVRAVEDFLNMFSRDIRKVDSLAILE